MSELLDSSESPDEGGRKLVAIMFTDIKGFSKKMSENETAAFELLKTHDSLMRVLAAKFGGKVIKSIGDSFMVDFPSAVNALRCAVEAQKKFWTFNQGRKDFDRIEIRVGIHLGDVIIRGEDIYGDGVNIAARLEAIAEPTRICISHDVYQQVKNKLPLQFFRMGAMELKNIADPVEVYEVLLDTIPELAVPSKRAQQAVLSKRVEAAPALEAEEAQEARSIEAAKGRAAKGLVRSEEAKQKQIEEIYTRAERFFEEGRYEEAERELNEISKIDPGYLAAAEKKKDEDEKKRRADEHIAQARALVSQRKLAEAEAELNEIFRDFPLYPAAQQVVVQIEEERYLIQEDERAKRAADTAPRELSQDQKKILEFLERARKELEEERFQDSLFTLREVFVLDPNNSAARRLEETIKEAERAKVEMERVEAERQAEEQRAQQLSALQKKLEAQRAARQIVHEKKGKVNYKLIAVIVLGLGAAVGIFEATPYVIRMLFPNTTSLVAVAMPGAERIGDPVQDALPLLLSEDFARCAHVSVVSVAPALSEDSKPATLAAFAAAFHVRHVLGISVERSGERQSVTIHVWDNEAQATMAPIRLDFADLAALQNMRMNIVEKTLDLLQIDSPIDSAPPLSPNPAALAAYFRGLPLLQRPDHSNRKLAASEFAEAVADDSTFGAAWSAYAEAVLGEDALGTPGEHDPLEMVQRALRLNPDDARAHEALGIYYRLSQHFDKVSGELQKSLDIQPANAQCYRELALVDLVGGDYDTALKNATEALGLDPHNPSSHTTLGLVHQMKHEFGPAVSAYQDAIRFGADDSLLTTLYVLDAWNAAGQYDKAAEYCKGLLRDYPDDYRAYYWLGRTYQTAVNTDEATRVLNDGLAAVKKVVDQNPSDAVAHSFFALMATRLGNWSDGESEMKRARELSPNSVDLLYREAGMYSIQKKYPSAAASLKAAVAKRYDFSRILNPDLLLFSNEPEFATIITRPTEPAN
ncbi:MAG TPA: adenylate/guanylate cyclase domain-containing protein [Bacteroidota bacterium]|nr:adenylate/guanylate cyclase domain-containing protein [Bacteroidota bacterium]